MLREEPGEAGAEGFTIKPKSPIDVAGRRRDD